MRSETPSPPSVSALPLAGVDSNPTSDLKVAIHPLVLLAISDHHTRCRLNHAMDHVFGALAGTTGATGKEICLRQSFELKMDDDGKPDQAFFEKRVEKLRQVLPKLEVFGVYSTSPTPPRLDTLLFLHLNPNATANQVEDLPVELYEVNETRLVPIPYTIGTSQTERVAVEYVTNPPITTQGQADDFEGMRALNTINTTKGMIAHLRSLRNAVAMLYNRIRTLQNYLDDVKGGRRKVDHGSLRMIRCLRSTVGEDLHKALKSDNSDGLLISYLSALTHQAFSTNELLDKFLLGYRKEVRDLEPPHGPALSALTGMNEVRVRETW